MIFEYSPIAFTLLTDKIGAGNAKIEHLLNENNIKNPGYFRFLMLLSFNKCSISALPTPIYQSVE